MKYYQTVTLKNGKNCIIRHAEAADAAEVRRSFLQTHAETDNLLTYPEESKMTVEARRNSCKRRQTAKMQSNCAQFWTASLSARQALNPSA